MVRSHEMADLESEMKLLRWHKLANESALKAAIIKNNTMKRKEKSMLRLPFDVNARLNEVIKEENSADLVANDDFIKRYKISRRKIKLTRRDSWPLNINALILFKRNWKI